MGLRYTPKSEPLQAPDFILPGVDERSWSLANVMGRNGLVVMFICNHCPYVKSIMKALVSDARRLQKIGVNAVAIMSNDVAEYPEDSFDNMRRVADRYQFPFPYLYDESQQIARAYGAVCTPDFFGLDAHGVLRYRGRLDAAGIQESNDDYRRDLVLAMKEWVETGQITTEQHPSMGCSIKWKTETN
ncbi:thioredoxin family protein [Marinicella sediminis]|nr:thioredoxin family protein [Marinicella sediminis]